MSAPALIPCPACNGLNRIPSERLGDAPRCGRCKSPVLPAAPITLSQASFAAQLKGDLPLLVDVWADWCGPCKRFSPIYEDASTRHEDVVFAKVDTEDARDLAGALEIQSIPTIMGFKDGKLVFRQSGLLSGKQLDSLIAQIQALEV